MLTPLEVAKEELRGLVSRGWTPPGRLLEQYRPLLAAYYRGRGLNFMLTDGAALSDTDITHIIGIMGVLDYLRVEHPEPIPASQDVAA